MLALALAVSLGACGDDGETTPQTRFAAALATVEATDPIGTGYGWIDVERLRQGGQGFRSELDSVSDALGPGADTIITSARAARRVGVDAAAADSLLSVATSYALAVRLDGVDPKRVEAALARAGARSKHRGEWTTFELGGEWTAPLGTSLEPLSSIVARDATRDSAIILARSDLAREYVMSSAEPAIDAPVVAVAADCLGDVVAARLVLNNHTYLPNVGPELLAFGVRAPDSGPTREVLCALGEPRVPVDVAARSLSHAFDPGARDALSHEPMSSLVANSDVAVFDQAGLRVARAEVVDALGAEPGLMFRAFNRGSMLTYLGLQPPPTPGSGPETGA
jgi:hypothetical protein